MWLRSRQVYPVAYQWRRILTLAVGRRARSPAIAWAVGSLPVAIALTLRLPARPASPLRFYLPAELTRLRRLAPI